MESSVSEGVLTTPTSTKETARDTLDSMTPNPQRVSPGSMPRIRTLLVCVELVLNVRGHSDVGEHVLDVVAVFKGINESEDLACRLGVHID